MKLVFFGTPDYVVPVCEKLYKSFKTKGSESGVVAVVTQPARPTGRKKVIAYSPVDAWAHKKDIPIFYKAEDLLKKNIQADIGILASYGEIISKFVISHFKFGILNIHPSLLPKFRGSSPVQATILTGDEPGATIIKIDEVLDHGPILSQFKEEVQPNDTTESLRARLFERSGEVLVALLPAYLKGKITPREQDHESVTFTRQLKKDDGFIPPKYLNAALEGASFKGKWKIDFIKPTYTMQPTPDNLDRFIRVMQPWPVSWTFIQLTQGEKPKVQRRLKILKAHTNESSVISHKLLVLDQVQPEGKNPVPWKQFKESYPKASF